MILVVLTLYKSIVDSFSKALHKTCHSCILIPLSVEFLVVTGAVVIVAGQDHLPQRAEG